MANLGDNVTYLLQSMADNFQAPFGTDAPTLLALALIIVVGWVAIKAKLDRGSIVLVTILLGGLLMEFDFLPSMPAWVFAALFIIAAYIGYAFLGMTRQGEG